jgi:hypothetical protein
MPSSYYDDATKIIAAYMGCAPEKRIEFVRQVIGSEETELDLNKVYKAIDAILLNVEKARGQLASQLALAYCTTAPATQLALFAKTDMLGRYGLEFNAETGEVQ